MSSRFLQTRPSIGVGGNEVEDQAILALAVSVDAPHPLLQPIRIPWNVVVDEEMAELQVDAFARRLGGDHHLHVALLELLLGVEPRTRFVAIPMAMLPWMQPTRSPHSFSLSNR